ncbi:DUF2239 family protein [Paenirhodobacter sp.]|uniref:DUF2239 family protein n=1 Tax=Paenirhodobacter sp. TaxID=1965326 RepID=UPI003B3DB70D
MTSPNWTAFAGHLCIAAGSQETVARAVSRAGKNGVTGILIFDDSTGRQVEPDLRGSEDEIVARLAPSNIAEAGRGRPKLGVTAREVTLLPRHWEWLAQQPGGASGTLRRLVDEARASPAARRRQAQMVTDRFLSVVAGDLPGYEEVSRALYAGNGPGFEALIAGWSQDIRTHALRFAADAFDRDAGDG